MDPITWAMLGVAAVITAGVVLYERGAKALGGGKGTPALPPGKAAPDRGLVPLVPVSVSDAHREHWKALRPKMIAGATKALGRAPNLAELLYLHAISFLETQDAQGWKGSMVGSKNYGAVQCSKAQQGGAGGGGAAALPASQQKQIEALNAAAAKAQNAATLAPDDEAAQQAAVKAGAAALAANTAAQVSDLNAKIDAIVKANGGGAPAKQPGDGTATDDDIKKAMGDFAKSAQSVAKGSGLQSAPSSGDSYTSSGVEDLDVLGELGARVRELHAAGLAGAKRARHMADVSGADMGDASPRCIAYQDSNPDGSTYPISFKGYETDEEGIADLAREVFSLRPGVVRALESDAPSVFRASLAMRREHYYGGFCPEATKAHGADAAKASFQTPDRDAGTLACQAEAVTAHAHTASSLIDQIATACGDTQRPPYGTLDDAIAWWKSGSGKA